MRLLHLGGEKREDLYTDHRGSAQKTLAHPKSYRAILHPLFTQSKRARSASPIGSNHALYPALFHYKLMLNAILLTENVRRCTVTVRPLPSETSLVTHDDEGSSTRRSADIGRVEKTKRSHYRRRCLGLTLTSPVGVSVAKALHSKKSPKTNWTMRMHSVQIVANLMFASRVEQ